MAWWIPTSWFEDLGAAKRVSLFNLKAGCDSSHKHIYHYTLSCKVKLPDGRIVEESAYTRGGKPYMDIFGFVSPNYYTDLTGELIDGIRKKYPRLEGATA